MDIQPQNKKNEITVALSTDTILYAPFFLAFYGGDFNDTPYGEFQINIVAREDDYRFNFEKVKLKGDGFFIFCLLFDYAEIGIGDPSFLIYLCESKEKTKIEKYFNDFVSTLSNDEESKFLDDRSRIIKKDQQNNYKIDVDELQKYAKERSLKILSGLISYFAFSVITNEKGKELINKYKDDNLKFGLLHRDNNCPSNFTKDENIKNIFAYSLPSTGGIIGKIHNEKYNKDLKSLDFGEELSQLQKFNDGAVAISCDFVAIDYRTKGIIPEDLITKNKTKESSPYLIERNSLLEIEDWVKIDDKNSMFTGIVGITSESTEKKFQAFLYGIDKIMYQINSFLKRDDTPGLTRYFTHKLQEDSNKRNEIISLLVADKECEIEIKKRIQDTDDLFSFHNVIQFYIKRLHSWKNITKEGKFLYYWDTKPIESDLKESCKTRFEITNPKTNFNEINFVNYLSNDIILDYRNDEKKILDLKQNQKKTKSKVTTFFLIFKYFFKFIFVWNNNLQLNRILWKLIDKEASLILIGSIFIGFEVATGLLHLFGIHLTMIFDILHCSECVKEVGEIGLFLIWLFVTIGFMNIIYKTRMLIHIKKREKYIYKDE